jgi:hypothetical protein
MLRRLSAALIAASMMVAPALAADTAKAPVAPVQTAAPDKATSTVEKTHVAGHVRHRHLRTAGRVHHHEHASHAASAHGKHVRHVAHARHHKPTPEFGSKPVVTSAPAAKAAAPASPNRMN